VEAEGAVAGQADLRVEAFEAAVGEPEADGGEDALAVAADRPRELDERPQLRATRPGEPGGEVLGCGARVLEVVERPQLLLEQEGARARGRELRRANEILKAASVFFAKELDPTGPR